MTAKSKRRSSHAAQSAQVASVPEESPPHHPRPKPPQPNKALLLVSAVLLLAWFCFLGWMALFQ